MEYDEGNIMNHRYLLACLAGVLLLVTLVSPVAASPSITSITPSEGTNSGSLFVTLEGSNFNLTPSQGTVVLMRSGKSNITASISSPADNTNRLTCRFTLTDQTPGTWDVVVVNQDGSSATSPTPFTIRSTMTLTSVSPTSAKINDDVTVKVVGTGLSDVSHLYLYRSGYTNLSANPLGTTESMYVTGTFDLTNKAEETYQVCVRDSVGTEKCGLSFEVTTDQLGTIDLSSSPSGASVYVDSTYKGTSPCIIPSLATGSHSVKLILNGYSDWSRSVKVTNGGNTTIVADLSPVVTATATTVPTSKPTTVKTSLKVTTVKVPTSWARTTTTKASPVEGIVIIGAICLGALVLIRKN